MEEGGTLMAEKCAKRREYVPGTAKLSKLQNTKIKTHHFLMQNYKKVLTLTYFTVFLYIPFTC